MSLIPQSRLPSSLRRKSIGVVGTRAMLLSNDTEGRLIHSTGWDALVDDRTHVPDNKVDYPSCDDGEPACVIADEYSIGYSNI